MEIAATVFDNSCNVQRTGQGHIQGVLGTISTNFEDLVSFPATLGLGKFMQIMLYGGVFVTAGR